MPRFYYVTNWLFPRMLPLFRIRVRVTGIEHVPLEGPLLLVANHTSILDPPLVGSTMPRDVVFMSKIENFEGHPLYAWVVRHYGAFPIHRGEADVRAIRQALRVLAEGRALFVAPEGTRHPDGVLGEPYVGAAMLAQRNDTPIVPLGISGAHNFQQRLRRWEPMNVQVRVGPMFRLRREGKKVGRETHKLMSDAIMERIAQLLPPENRGRFGQHSEVQELVELVDT